MTQSQPEFVKLTDEQVRARKRRNVAIALGLLVFIATVYAITVSRMHANNEARKAADAAANAAAGAVPSTPQAEVAVAERP
ncbi:hypothetical protein [uncultured Brevundimonas sp.]|uniref:hypothetical protein n=1 Tax=uncultured Brevundimonas sp. TaxID=213418 RepID=UPI002622ADF5|nr:hypothetical protein [uncultured Brevundimonas sp.]